MNKMRPIHPREILREEFLVPAGLSASAVAIELKVSEGCGGDMKVFISRRASAGERRAELDDQYVARFAARVRELYPRSPRGREQRIAEHACRR